MHQPVETGSSEPVGPVQRIIRRFFKQFAAVEPAEFSQTVTAFFLFFCVLGGYFAVRPVRETFGTIMGEDRVADLYVATWVASLAIIPVYGALCAWFRRSTFLPWIYAFISILLAVTAAIYSTDQENILIAQIFYVTISVVNLFVVSVFWSFLLELFQPQQTKRLFPAIAAGGTLGALLGPLTTSFLVGRIGNTGILLTGALVFVVAIFLQRRLLSVWKAGNIGGSLRTVDQPMGGNFLSGILLILKSPYLLGIALFVVFLASVSTLLYMEQLVLVRETFTDVDDRTRVFSQLDTIVQTLTIVSQLVITGRVAQRWGVVPLLTIVPVVMIAGFIALATWYSFAVLAIVFVARRAGEYAFVRPGREMLFAAVDLETKYKAKNTIDVPVYRGADAAAAQMRSGLDDAGATPQTLAVLGAGVALMWAVNGFIVGRSRERRERGAEHAAAMQESRATSG